MYMIFMLFNFLPVTRESGRQGQVLTTASYTVHSTLLTEKTQVFKEVFESLIVDKDKNHKAAFAVSIF